MCHHLWDISVVFRTHFDIITVLSNQTESVIIVDVIQVVDLS